MLSDPTSPRLLGLRPSAERSLRRQAQGPTPAVPTEEYCIAVVRMGRTTSGGCRDQRSRDQWPGKHQRYAADHDAVAQGSALPAANTASFVLATGSTTSDAGLNTTATPASHFVTPERSFSFLTLFEPYRWHRFRRRTPTAILHAAVGVRVSRLFAAAYSQRTGALVTSYDAGDSPSVDGSRWIDSLVSSSAPAHPLSGQMPALVATGFRSGPPLPPPQHT